MTTGASTITSGDGELQPLLDTAKAGANQRAMEPPAEQPVVLCFGPACCQCCILFSIASTVTLFFFGLLLRTQPEYVIEVNVKDTTKASSDMFGAAVLYTAIAMLAAWLLHQHNAKNKRTHGSAAISDPSGDFSSLASASLLDSSERKIELISGNRITKEKSRQYRR